MAEQTDLTIAEQPIPDMIGLTVDSALIYRLGYELVGRAETAVSELIKNAYDADARKVDVFFRNTDEIGGTITVRDNGTGMDFVKLKNGFPRISTSDKVDNPTSERYQRPRAGRKGIGRFATQRIGDQLTITTCRLDMDYALQVTIDWRKYQPKTDIEDILFPITKLPKEMDEGTELVITGVRDVWNETSIRRVHRYVMELFQPDYLGRNQNTDQIENTFETNFWRWAESGYVPIERGQEDFFSKALAIISGNVEEDNIGKVCVVSESLGMAERMQMDGEFPLLKGVRFKAYYYIYERPEYYSNGMSSMTLKAINKVATTASGIRLYRNGFRVLPYGEPSNDWINLNARWAGGSGVNIPFGTHNLFGYVELVDQEGLLFDETSSREGLIENDAFFQLRDFLYKAFVMARNRISSSQELQRLKENRGATDPTEPQPDLQESTMGKLAVISSYVESRTETAGSEEERQKRRAIEYLVSVGRALEEMEMLRESFSFCASSNPVTYCGAKPVFVDSEEETWNMSPELLEGAIKDRIVKTGKKPKAIIVVDLYGMPAQWDEITAISQKYDIPVIEDAANALGSFYKGRPCGTFGDIATLSFNGNKMITTSGGGAIVCKDLETKQKAIFLATQAKESCLHYEHETIGYNYRMSNICAGIGRGQMTVLEDHISHHQHVCELYRELFYNAGIEVHVNPSGDFDSNYWLTTVMINGERRTENGTPKGSPTEWEVKRRTENGAFVETLCRQLDKAGIEARPVWKPMHLQPVFKDASAYDNGVSERLFKTGMCLPAGPYVSDDDVRYIVDTIKTAIL